MRLSVIILIFIGFVRSEPSTDYKDVAQKSLVQAHVIFRHGARGPVVSYPGDPNHSEKLWPNGFGELTQEGLRQQYELGRWLRHRYGSILTPKWHPKNIQVHSSAQDRCLNSAAANLAGLYSSYYLANTSRQFHEGLPWAPTPISSTPRNSDLLIDTDKGCARLIELNKEGAESGEVQQYLDSLHSTMALLTEKLGKNITTLQDLGMASDNFRLQVMYNLTIPSWAKPLLPILKEAEDNSYSIFATSQEEKILSAGPLLSKIMQDMSVKQNASDEGTNFVMYSGHDSTVNNVLRAQNLSQRHKPPFASAVVYELHQANDTFFVEMYYHNDSSLTRELHPLTLNDCQFSCPMDKFFKILEPLKPEEIHRQCSGAESHGTAGIGIYTIDFIIVTSIVLIFGCIALAILKCRTTKRHSCFYRQREDNKISYEQI